jgi:hypothetical protein
MPRKNRSAPVQIHNLGSREGARLDFGREELWERLTAPLTALAARLPVYLVSEAQMDHLFPPERRRFFREEKLRERLQEVRAQEREREDGEDDPFAPFQDLDDAGPDTWGRVSVVVAAGLYVRRLDPGGKGGIAGLAAQDPEPGAVEAFKTEEGPAIFLCPERILAWAQDVRVPEDLALDKVYCHELGHAYMDTADFHPDPYGRPWGRVVEESLANLVAFRRFQGAEALWVARMIRKQPPEYRGYAAASTHLFPFHQGLPPLPFWHPFFQEVWEDYLYWLRRRGFSLRYSPLLFLPTPQDPGELNPLTWREAKRLGLWQDPEAARAWGAFARFLLEEAVGA